MSVDEYQDFVKSVAVLDLSKHLDYTVLGLNGEAGEVADLYKKTIRDDGKQMRDETKQKLIDELGDVLWYVAATSEAIGCDLSEVMQRNVDKLTSRKERGVIGGSGDNR